MKNLVSGFNLNCLTVKMKKICVKLQMMLRCGAVMRIGKSLCLKLLTIMNKLFRNKLFRNKLFRNKLYKMTNSVMVNSQALMLNP